VKYLSVCAAVLAATLSGISTVFAANERLIGVANYCISVPADSGVNLSEGPDFSVTYISVKEPNGSVGLYEGGYPSRFSKDKAGITVRPAHFHSGTGQWTLWEESAGGPVTFHGEILLPAGNTKFHLFVAGKTAQDRDRLLTIAESFRPALPSDSVEHPPRPPQVKPQPPPPRTDSESTIGFRTRPISVNPVSDGELAYFLAHMEVVAESPMTNSPSDHRPSYRIIGVREQGNFVQGGPRTVVMVTVSDYYRWPDGHVRAFRVEGVHFWSFLGVEEWKADDVGGYFLSFRFQSMPTIDRKEIYRVQVGFDSATVTKVSEEKR
jgi:hypothetical protein